MNITGKAIELMLNGEAANISISLPDKLIAVVGDTLQLFYRGMVAVKNPYNYDIYITCNKGNAYPRYFQYLPTTGDIGTTTFTLEVRDSANNILATKMCNLVTVRAVQAPSIVIKILALGDSLTYDGIWAAEAQRRIVGSGGSPTALGLSNIAFVGRKQENGIGFEGNGGWNWDSYSTAGSAVAYRFNVTGVTTAPTIYSTYTNNGQTFTVQEINITSGLGYIRCLATGAPQSSGTLTKATGNGDSALSFSSIVQDVANPFWNQSTGQLDFGSYVNNYCGGSLHAIYVMLTWNVGQPLTDFTVMVNSAKVLFNHIHSVYPSLKIKIMGIPLPSLNGGLGLYGTGFSYAWQLGMIKTCLGMNKAYQDFANESSYSSYVEFINTSSQMDAENNMYQADTPVNTRSVLTEKLGTNGLHPTNDGLRQIGDTVFRNLIANYCQ